MHPKHMLNEQLAKCQLIALTLVQTLEPEVAPVSIVGWLGAAPGGAYLLKPGSSRSLPQ